MARKKDIGARFEEDVQHELEVFKRMGVLSFVRLYDSKSARGNYLPSQPGDFIVAAGKAWLIECKASEKYKSMAEGRCLEDNVKSTQAAEARLWAKAGNPCLFLFYSQPAGKLEVWDGEVVGECYAKRKKLGEPEVSVGSNMLSELLQAVLIGPVED